jgi:hypothetical protein
MMMHIEQRARGSCPWSTSVARPTILVTASALNCSRWMTREVRDFGNF